MKTHTLSIDEIEKLFNSIPRLNKRSVSWASSPEIVARIVADILSTTELPPRKVFCGSIPFPRNVRMKEIAEKLKVYESTLRFFVSGFKAGGNKSPWIELRNELTKLGIDWLGKNEETKVETTEKPIIRRQGEVIPHVPVVMESSGKVIPITPIPPPSAMIANPGEFAKNTKHSVTQTDVDNDGNFVITTSTVRIVKVGTPEYISMVKLAFQKKNKAEAV